MLNPETEALRLVAQSAILAAEKQRRDAEMDLNTHLVFMSNCSQSHVWDKIDFYSRPAAIEAAEREAYELIEDQTLWIEYESPFHPEEDEDGELWAALKEPELDEFDAVNGAVIEDYYEGGAIWQIA